MSNRYDSSKPKYTWGDGWHKKGCTKKQASYIAQLLDKRTEEGHEIQVTIPLNELKRGQASILIDELKNVAFYGSTHCLTRSMGFLVAVN